MTTGTITRLTDRGFGFIQPDAPEPAPVVVRESGLRAPLTQDALVTRGGGAGGPSRVSP